MRKIIKVTVLVALGMLLISCTTSEEGSIAMKIGKAVGYENKEGIIIKLQEAIRNGEREVKFLNVDAAELEKINDLLVAYEPYSGYVSDYMSVKVGFNNTVTLNYKVDGSVVKREIAETETYVDRFIKENIKDSDTDVEKVLKIYNHVIKNTDYLDSDIDKKIYYAHVPHGIISKGQVVCEGYAKMIQLILNKLEIDNIVVEGTGTRDNGNSELHAWNLVKIEGKWYHVDATWGDPIIDLEDNNYANDIGMSEKELKNLLGYSNFSKYLLVGDEEISKDHIWKKENYHKAEKVGLGVGKDLERENQLNILEKYNIVQNTEQLKRLIKEKVNRGEYKITFVVMDKEINSKVFGDLIGEAVRGKGIASYAAQILPVDGKYFIYNLKLK